MFKVMTVPVKMPLSIFKNTAAGIKKASSKPSVTIEYPSSSKKTIENTTAKRHALNRSQAVSTDFFREGWMQRIVKMPAATMLDTSSICEIKTAIGVAIAVLIVR